FPGVAHAGGAARDPGPSAARELRDPAGGRRGARTAADRPRALQRHLRRHGAPAAPVADRQSALESGFLEVISATVPSSQGRALPIAAARSWCTCIGERGLPARTPAMSAGLKSAPFQ